MRRDKRTDLDTGPALGLLYRLARHIRNTDDMPPIPWGVAGVRLLAELQALDPARYARLVGEDAERASD